ncbi:hypothetical protein [Bradyrhizobium sp. G127]|uniref:hypothetical protein n=1 Tax=Bradyrhizobium sp. G127 TaxID=2904800 RepID=UPI001F3F8369|nr:hypothetical protein [Bradyrhizobium sp. G127]MCF2524874.1 hypothetical protein [Bradyrhizobium sp. G127]
MRKDQLLAAGPPAPVQNLRELYAIASEMAERAYQRYGELAARNDENFWPVRCVFEVLTTRERDRERSLIAACTGACGGPPSASDLRWIPIDLVPADELADLRNSGLSTTYTAWTLAVRHRQRAFVFWTYVIALADDPEVRKKAEELAQEALRDGNLLRRERRLAWREVNMSAAHSSKSEWEPVSAALLESLLYKDIITWSEKLPSAQRARLLALNPFPPPQIGLADSSGNRTDTIEIEPIRRRALQRAEQLSNIYLDDADNAPDQDSMELAQKLAARSIMRLAGLRDIASADQSSA